MKNNYLEYDIKRWDSIKEEYKKYRENILSNNKEKYLEFELSIPQYAENVRKISEKIGNHKKMLRNEDTNLQNLTMEETFKKEEYDRMEILNNEEEKLIEELTEKYEQLENEINMVKLSTVAYESSCRVHEKMLHEKEVSLKELEDSIKCIVDLVSEEGSAILLLTSNCTRLEELRQSMIRDFGIEEKKLIKKQKQKMNQLEKCNIRIENNIKKIGRLKIQREKYETRRRQLNSIVSEICENIEEESKRLQEIYNSINLVNSNINSEKENIKELTKCLEIEDQTNSRLLFTSQNIGVIIDNYSNRNDNLNKNGNFNSLENLIEAISARRMQLDFRKRELSEEYENIILKINKITEDGKNKLDEKYRVHEKIANAKQINYNLLEKQRNLSNLEEKLQHQKNVMDNLKVKYDMILNKGGSCKR
ncbi:uncharacterized protein CMU_031260 [Cryptosporidium muris RN66]|uniref:Uncharacterized protein n=1 Tax=Cryptosporidium muris (strain RN66) TaxID=441375 RepID=B6AIE4_CRYMR|nr:uncharacterized protein CMU_031260 [Cryptosporidium muris RN66]EEA07985.1 hypothetical protein CMU_031260 [Cryptosporidium muris RN66]|eukprot:XP_002142334.1 hypothetical protein [Cryptosporidium muris RN66]